MAHSSFGSERVKGGTSPETVRTVLARGRLKEAIEGLVDSGGDGRSANRSRSAFASGLAFEMSATDGDCNGEWILDMGSSGSSPINGGSRGVVACGPDSSNGSWFALVMSMGRAFDSLTRSSKIVLAGDGGI